MSDNTPVGDSNKIVVCFIISEDSSLCNMIHQHNKPKQLSHVQTISVAKKISRADRLLVRLRLKQEGEKGEEVNTAVAKAYSFVVDHYQSGDEVILFVQCYQSSPHCLEAAEMLAWRLYNGKRPEERQLEPSDAKHPSSDSIPIYAIALKDWYNDVESVCAASDQVKLGLVPINRLKKLSLTDIRLPPGISNVILGTLLGGNCATCATSYDLNGRKVTREVHWHIGDYAWEDAFIFATKHIIYWKPEQIPSWDKSPSVLETIGTLPKENVPT
ncbi:hypothetical protein RSOLAG1IB_10472 [Rhizoctonia solani AG-1 IB]|uniref:Uncharacterized protein n=1 Tax=Thanatephorus cucumeris (strain AG1-IB / isolate 7/3/14) TaxID=1108050 RepID=A0A0B7FYJ5_THACB|nr:hypothetical protein RSOLAG1IB_10472 [Rhizoctonia solani AG-1 IB]